MQPSQYEIQREVEALRDIKRRSTANNGVTLDPDLPDQRSPTQHQYWSPSSSSSAGFHTPPLSDGDSSSDSHGTSEDIISNNPADDPFHLFWVPASVHPEIAPAEFRAFLKEHSDAAAANNGTLSRSASTSSTSSALGRKKSMLSRQYKPREGDGVEDEQVVPLRRNRSSLYSNQGPQLTINDLQRLEELAEEAQESDDPSKLRTMLRRSLSMNISPSVIDTMDNIPDMGDEADAPIIVPPPGQILRRAARTKIRKPGLPGDGGGHRFGSSRRGGSSRSSATSDRTSAELTESVLEPVPRRRTHSESAPLRPESYSEETSIYESYARDDDDQGLFSITPPPPEDTSEKVAEAPPVAILEALAPVLQHPQPQRLAVPEPAIEQSPEPSRTPSPVSVEAPSPVTPSPTQPQQPIQSLPPAPGPSTPHHPQQPIYQTPSPTGQRKDKDKKGLFGKWGSDKNHKKGKDNLSRDRSDKEKEGFFGSLFGSKKKHEEGHSVPVGSGAAAGREAAQALLGASKSSKAFVPPTSPAPVGGNPWARYPIHVERAIYRLSHIKLANPRRPLYEQVLISNLMFWYLGVINKTNNPTPATPPQNQEQVQANNEGGSEDEKRSAEEVEKERMEKERAEKERQEKEVMEAKKKESGRRGPLSRPPASGARRAETPVRGPQYEMQHRAMEQEYGKPEPKLVQPQPTNYADNFYYNADQHHHPSPGLPPGAMPPVERDPVWSSRGSPPPKGNPRRSQSPPQKGYGPDGSMTGRTPSRSLSAIASPVPAANQQNGRLRKGNSAHAVPYTPRPRTADGTEGGGEEEDVPLAMWQQRR